MNLAGIPTPPDILERLQKGHYKYVILDNDLPHEWLPPDLGPVFKKYYRNAGPVLPDFEDAQLKPVTGAPMKPRLLFEYQGMPPQ
jgi:hypothetical protein